MSSLQASAHKVAEALVRFDHQLVLAESCTAGLVAATLAGVPGISRHLCGSAVVYQERTKAAWLDVPESLFAASGVVSAEVAAAMTAGALNRTPYADVAASVTGHLGPDAPSELDGFIYVAVARRGGGPEVTLHRLSPENHADRIQSRLNRQVEAAAIMLEQILRNLEER